MLFVTSNLAQIHTRLSEFLKTIYIMYHVLNTKHPKAIAVKRLYHTLAKCEKYYVSMCYLYLRKPVFQFQVIYA